MKTTEVAPETETPTANSRQETIFDITALLSAQLLFLGVLAVYLLTLSHTYSPDSMSFALLADRGQLFSPLFFQAEHLLWPFAGWAWYHLWLSLGYGWGPLVPMQFLSAFAGAAGVALFFLSLRAILGASARGMVVSVFSALLLAFSYGYWFHSTEAEDQIIATALTLGAFLILVATVRETKADANSLAKVKIGRFGFGSAFTAIGNVLKSPPFILSLVMGLAILAHGTALLHLPALALGMWLKERRLRPALGLVVGTVVFAGLALVLLGALSHGLRSPGDYVSWLLAAPSNGVWGKLSPRNFWVGAQGLANAVVFLQGGPVFKALLSGAFHWRNALSVVLFLGVGALSVLAVAYLAFLGRGGPPVAAPVEPPADNPVDNPADYPVEPPVDSAAGTRVGAVPPWPPLRREGVCPSDRRNLALVCLGWIAVVGLFDFFWAPEDIQFWIALVPPLIVAVTLAYQDLSWATPAREKILIGMFALGVALVFVINLVTAVIPRADSGSNMGLAKALCLGQASKSEDLFITPGWDWVSSYGPYFAKREVFSVVDSYLLDAGSNRDTLLRVLNDRITATWARGGKAYFVRLFNLDQNDSIWLERTTGLTVNDFSLLRKQVWNCGGEVVWEIVQW
ncbi:MAG: hypothetical protein Q7O66_02420 [Dehalococcoidia bacterium]|nr:hypothetical protein [Dehalococcoidia bacterium]